ncbi:HTH-type transcriptional regulator SutR [Clostridiales bacterium]|nr:HTH-type transcriptional regulator SutR [Clostridiales bacterium]
MDITNTIATNTKKIREQKKLTLDTAASVTGVSRSMLAQIEKGEVNPTISVLWKIANGYKVSFTSLVEEKSDAVSVIRQADMQPLKEDNGRYLNYPIFAFDEQKLFETYRIVIEAGGSLSAQPHLKGAVEYITVFAGQIEITVAGEPLQLSKGDSIRFSADVPHEYQNTGTEIVELSMLIYYCKS